MSEQAPATNLEQVDNMFETRQAELATQRAEQERQAQEAAAAATRQAQEARATAWVDMDSPKSKRDFDRTQDKLRKLDEWEDDAGQRVSSSFTLVPGPDAPIVKQQITVEDALLDTMSAQSAARYQSEQVKQQNSYKQMSLKQLAEAQAQAELDGTDLVASDLQKHIDEKLDNLVGASESRHAERSGSAVSVLDDKGDVSPREAWNARIQTMKDEAKQRISADRKTQEPSKALPAGTVDKDNDAKVFDMEAYVQQQTHKGRSLKGALGRLKRSVQSNGQKDYGFRASKRYARHPKREYGPIADTRQRAEEAAGFPDHDLEELASTFTTSAAVPQPRESVEDRSGRHAHRVQLGRDMGRRLVSRAVRRQSKEDEPTTTTAA